MPGPFLPKNFYFIVFWSMLKEVECEKPATVLVLYADAHSFRGWLILVIDLLKETISESIPNVVFQKCI